jgi:hypothetical protein
MISLVALRFNANDPARVAKAQIVMAPMRSVFTVLLPSGRDPALHF